MITINIFKIKKGKEETWHRWCRRLNSTLKKEASGTLEEEGVDSESCFTFKIGAQSFVVGVLEHPRGIFPANMKKKINVMHREKKKECLQYLGRAPMLYSLRNKK